MANSSQQSLSHGSGRGWIQRRVVPGWFIQPLPKKTQDPAYSNLLALFAGFTGAPNGVSSVEDWVKSRRPRDKRGITPSMNFCLLDGRDVTRFLPMARCIQLMEKVLLALQAGKATQPLRSITWLPDRRGLLGLMPAILEDPPIMGVKVLSVFPGNTGTPPDSHQGAVLLFETKTGHPLALVDATAITAIRTAAVSAVATRLMAREDAGSLALLGSGVQARTHLESILHVRRLHQVRVFSRNAAHARAFARRESRRHDLEVTAVAQAREAVNGADIVCTVSGASQPILQGDWLAPGTHINAVGACTPHARELDGTAVARSHMVTDRRESVFAEAGDLLLAIQEGAVSQDIQVGELGEILEGSLPGRSDPEEITLFESLGLAVEDLAAAYEVYERARKADGGTWMPWGGEWHGSD